MPPRSTPRLASIDPPRLAREVVAGVVNDIQGRALALAPGLAVLVDAGELDGQRRRVADVLPETELYQSVLDLCAWAQRGDGHPDETHDVCLPVATAVYPGALDGSGESGPADLAGEADPTTEVGLLLVAAFAREKLSQGRALSARELATLASLSVLQLRTLIKRGELRASGGADKDWTVKATEARRWLSGRGVPGFAQRPSSSGE